MSDWSDWTTKIPSLLRDLENNASIQRYGTALQIGAELVGVVESALGAIRFEALKKQLDWSEDEHYRYVTVNKEKPE